MGAWGEKTFESDSALDFFGEFCGGDQTAEVLENVFDRILSTDEYLDSDYCSEVLVAGEIIAFVHGKGEEDFPSAEFYTPYINTELLKPLITPALIQKAIVAIQEVSNSEHSELKDLWEEDEESFLIWQAAISDLITRLSSLLSL